MNNLVFYIKTKEYEYPIEIVNFSRSSEIYQYFIDHFKASKEVRKLDITDIREIQSVIYTDIYKNKARLETYDKYAHMNKELVEEVIGIKEYLGQLTKAKFYLDFIALMVEEANARYSKTTEIGYTLI